jgi:hypothetical protein
VVTATDPSLQPCPACGTLYRAKLTRGECPVCGWRESGAGRARWAGLTDTLDIAGVAAVTALNLLLLAVLLLVVNHR